MTMIENREINSENLEFLNNLQTGDMLLITPYSTKHGKV